MLETAVGDSSDELVLEQEVAETGGMDADVAALLVAGRVRRSEATLGRSRAAVGGHLWLDLLVGVVDEIFLVRHGECVAGREMGVCGGGCCRACHERATEEGAVAWVPLGAVCEGGRQRE